jgi:putative endonuclease
MAGLVPAIHVLLTSLMAGGFVYMMSNRRDGILYVGITSDLLKRAYEHRTGAISGFTKRYGLKRLVWFEQHDDIRSAIQRHDEALAAGLEGSNNSRHES